MNIRKISKGIVVFFVFIATYFSLIQPFIWGWYFSTSAPIEQVLDCAGSSDIYYRDIYGEDFPKFPFSWVCRKGIYLFRGSSQDVKAMNSGINLHLLAVVTFPDKIEAKKMFEFWVAKGADINIQDQNSGFTLLHYASGFGDYEMVKFLLSSGEKTGVRDNKGRTPLDIALIGQKSGWDKPFNEIAKLLGDK